jgi:hypothetical protein
MERSFTDIYLDVIETGKNARLENYNQYREQHITEQIGFLTQSLNKTTCNLKGSKSILSQLLYIERTCILRKGLAMQAENPLKIDLYKRFMDDVLMPLQKVYENKIALECDSNIVKQDENATTVIMPNDKLCDSLIIIEQINCNASEEQILDFFMLLDKPLYPEGDVLMEKSSIEEFCKNNFTNFNSEPKKKYFNINIKNKRTLVYFIYQFYYHFDKRGSKLKYAMLLINNFEAFKNDNPNNIITNFSKAPKEIDKISLEDFKKKYDL